MKRFSEQLKKKADSIRLKAHERRDLRDRIVSYMEYHPMTTPQVASQKKKLSEAIVSEPFKVISIHATYIRSFVGVFALFLVIGVPLIAEKAVPGDVLYPVKVQFNEELRSSLAFSPYAKVEWETERLERRIAEARLLAEEGKLTQEIEAEVALAFETHKNAAQKEIAALRESDSDEADIAEITFASVLAVQSEVLENDAQKDGSTEAGRSVAALAGVVAQAHLDAETAQTDSAPSYEKLLARIEAETTLAQELFSSINQSASPEEVASIERRLADIQRKVARAIVLHNEASVEVEISEEVSTNTSFADIPTDTATTATTSVEETVPEVSEADVQNKEATALLRSALTDTRKLISFMTDIDVRANVSIEDLVPVVLTEEEELAAIQALYDQTLEIRADLTTLEVAPSVEEKFIFGISLLDSLLPKAEQALKELKISQARVHTEEASEIAQDLLELGSRQTQKGTTTPSIDDQTNENEKGTTTDDVVDVVVEGLDI